MERRKFDAYLLSPTHPVGKHKLRLWRGVFGVGEGDAALLERLIREQLSGGEPVEKEEKEAREEPSKVARLWEIVIPRFEGQRPHGSRLDPMGARSRSRAAAPDDRLPYRLMYRRWYNRAMAPKTHAYEELEMVAVPEDVPELGVEAGDEGVVSRVYDGGRRLLVEIGREDGTSAGFVDLKVGEDGIPSVVGYSLLSNRP